MSAAVTGLAADPRVPGRDVLLDEREMSARLSRLLGADGPLDIDRYERRRVKYKIGDSLRVLHAVHVGGAAHLVASRTFPDGRSELVYERARRSAHETGALRGVAHDAELESVFWAFPNDRKIPGLAGLAPATDRVSSLLGRRIQRTVLAAYAPEKSATAACMARGSDGPVAYAKVFASPEEAAASLRVHTELSALLGDDDRALRLPAVLAYSHDDRMLVVEAVHGRRIDMLRASGREHAMRRFGAALAALHELPVPAGLARFTRLDPNGQAQAARLLATARPDVAAEAQRLRDELAARPPAPDGAAVCLHGDVHGKNALLQGERVALIDLDQAGVGPAAADVASAVAALRYDALLGGDAARGRRLEHALLEGYASRRRPPSAEALRWHLAAAMLCERALRAVNRLRLDGLAMLPAVLAEARVVLGEGARR
jgi:Ser/Thr protein kinase RdoA (MazF antagonist)